MSGPRGPLQPTAADLERRGQTTEEGPSFIHGHCVGPLGQLAGGSLAATQVAGCVGTLACKAKTLTIFDLFSIRLDGGRSTLLPCDGPQCGAEEGSSERRALS